MTYMRISTILICTLALSLSAIPKRSYAESPVTLRGQSEVKRIAVKLSDVFLGVPEEIDRDIAQAPAPCKQVVYDINVLTRLSQKYRLDWSPQSLSDRVVITSACTRITIDAIRDAIVQKIKDDGIKGEPEVTFDNHTLEIDLPANQSDSFNLNNFTFDRLNKRFHTDLVSEGANGTYDIPVTGHLVIKQNVPVLRHRLEGGTIITSNDIDWLPVIEDHLNINVVIDPQHLVGRELRRDTDGGILLHTNDIMPPRHVTRGALITLKIETPFMFLSAQGRALQDGAEGDVVRVINTQSNRTLEGTVEGPGVVRIQIAQKIANIE